jgi:hypothetical protein
VLDYDIRQYRGNAHIVAFSPDFVYPNSRQLAFGIPNNSLFQILSKLKDACIYFSPECKEYMDKMKVIVVEDDDVNAYTTMGNAFVKLSR